MGSGMKCPEGLRKCPEAWADPSPSPHTLNGAGQRPPSQHPLPCPELPPDSSPSFLPAWAGLPVQALWCSKEGQLSGRGSGKTPVVMETTHGHRMPF